MLDTAECRSRYVRRAFTPSAASQAGLSAVSDGERWLQSWRVVLCRRQTKTESPIHAIIATNNVRRLGACNRPILVEKHAHLLDASDAAEIQGTSNAVSGSPN